LRAREIDNTSDSQRQGSSQAGSKAHPPKDSLQSGVYKSRIEKQASLRASTEMRREPTPPSRHITRIIASLPKVDTDTHATSSEKASQQCREETVMGIPQSKDTSRAMSETDSRAKTGEKAQILKAPANFGGLFSAPPRTFENVAAGTSSYKQGIQ
jgi:hypothetical protein